jgi:phosphoglycerate dehydrogenase-like enzyme
VVVLEKRGAMHEEGRMPQTVLMTTAKFAHHGEYAREFLRAHDCTLLDHTRRQPMDEAALLALVAEADALIAGPEPVTARVLAAAPRLRVVNAPGVGYDHIDVAEATRRGIAVCVCTGANHYAVAEMTLGLMIALARRIPYVDRAVRGGAWPSVTGPELWGKTLGIVGLGHIGKSLALIARGLGMRVLATDAFWDITFANVHQISYVPLPHLLAQADFVSLHCPLTAQTRDLINDDTLALMKPTAYLINTARGPLVDEEALLRALRAERIAGAALDVFLEEPQRESPFAAFDSVILSAHRGGATHEAVDRSAEIALQNVTRVLNGEPPLYPVNAPLR